MTDYPKCILCDDPLTDFEIQIGSGVCLPTERMLAANPDITSGCERDLDTVIVFSDTPPPPKI